MGPGPGGATGAMNLPPSLYVKSIEHCRWVRSQDPGICRPCKDVHEYHISGPSQYLGMAVSRLGISRRHGGDEPTPLALRQEHRALPVGEAGRQWPGKERAVPSPMADRHLLTRVGRGGVLGRVLVRGYVTWCHIQLTSHTADVT
jgi:hypothetical protein